MGPGCGGKARKASLSRGVGDIQLVLHKLSAELVFFVILSISAVPRCDMFTIQVLRLHQAPADRTALIEGDPAQFELSLQFLSERLAAYC